MPDNNLNLKVTNGTVNIEDLIDKINMADDNGLIKDSNYMVGNKSVDEALEVLRTNQIIRDTKKVAENTNRMLNPNAIRSRYLDAFSNPAAKTGWGEDNLINATQYPLTRLTQDWQLLTSLYRTSWIVQRVCNSIPEDAMASLDIEAPGLSTDELHRLQEEIRSTHIRESLLEAMCWGRLYGGAAAIIMISGQEEDLSVPIDKNNIMPGAFRGLYVVDRWSGIYPSLQLVENERDPDFGLPEYYEVRNENGGGSYQVHHSRVLRFRGMKMPFWEEQAEQYWGISAIETMYDELVKHDNVAHNIANLTFKANLTVLQVENLDQMFATSSTVHQRRMYAMLSAINTLENSMGIRLVNKGDDIQQLQYSFSGLPEVMDSAMMDMAGATSIPVTRLFGRSPAGMNSTGESDDRMYRQTLERERSVHIVPALERLIPIVCRSAIGRFPPGAKFKLPDLLEIPPSEKAQMVEQQLGPLERLFQANLIPGNVVLEGFRTAQQTLGITSQISDEDIEKVRGKYMNQLQNMSDPYGGAMQAGADAMGGQQTDENGNPIPQTDENGNPVQPQVDENGNPVQTQVDENGNPIEQQQVDENGNPIEQSEEEQEGAINAAKAQYKEILKTVSPKTAKKVVLQTAIAQGVTPEDLLERYKEQRESLKKEKKRMRQFEKVINSQPTEVSQDIVATLAAEQEMDPNAFAGELQNIENPQQQEQQAQEQQMQQPQQANQAEEQQQEQPQEQPQEHEDAGYRIHRKMRYGKDYEDSGFMKFKRHNKKQRRDWDY